MNMSWCALMCFSFLWPAALHFFEPPSQATAILLLAAGLACCCIQARRDGLKGMRCVKQAGLETLLILPVQAAIVPFYILFAARIHDESIFAALAARLLSLFGVQTIAEGSNLYLSTFRGTYGVLSTWEKAGFFYLLMTLAGGLCLLLLRKAGVKRIGIFCGLVFAYGVLRYVFLLLLVATVQVHSLFWERTITFVSFLPLFLLLGVIFRHLKLSDFSPFFVRRCRKKSILAFSLGFALMLAGVAFFGWHDPGIEKKGRVLVDEFHSDWEWTTEAYNTQWFGQRSGYNYYCFYEYISKFYETNRNMAEITADTLAGVDVLVMKTPTKPFTEEEIQAMYAFVEKGGGLYLLGDHTNVFGTGTNLNALSERFGLKFHYDATYELVEGTLSEYGAPQILPHPVVAPLPHFLFATSDTLGASWMAEEVMIGYGLQCYPVDYSQKNFFPEKTDGADLSFGHFLQSAGVYYGSGRVLAFTDSTVFSNFWMFMPGKPELLLSSLAWLNQENAMNGISPRALSLAALLILFIALAVLVMRMKRAFPAGFLVMGGVAALLFGCLLFGLINRGLTVPPEPRKPIVQIAFEEEYSQMAIPKDLEGFLAGVDEQLSTFYVWTQRLGYCPALHGALEEALREGRVAVVTKPGEEISNSHEIMQMVEEGGRLLILDNVFSGGHSNSLLELAGMRLEEAEMGSSAAYGEIQDILLTENACRITGGMPWVEDERGNAVLSVQEVGKGVIAVFSDPDLMYGAHLGDVSANLTPQTEILSRLEFKLLRALAEE